MSRNVHKPFDINDLLTAPNDEARNRLIHEWWCDEGDATATPPRRSDRLVYFATLDGVPTAIPSRAPVQDDPAPPASVPAVQGFAQVLLLSDPADVQQALIDTAHFSNRPYAALGGASFLLGMDPGLVNGIDWHQEQSQLLQDALALYPSSALNALAARSVEQAMLTCLTTSNFDLAALTEQAALRYMGQLFGYGFQDHGLLQDASRATYRALQYLAVGKHFVTEPETVPAAQQALARLIGRSSELMEDYTHLTRSPRLYGWPPGRDWPKGVLPWSVANCSDLGEPLLKVLPKLPDPTLKFSHLSGRDRATVAATLLAGTLGNIQTAVCLLMQGLLLGRPDELALVRGCVDPQSGRSKLEDAITKVPGWLLARLECMPPVPVLPRRVLQAVQLRNGLLIQANTDCLLLLEAPQANACPHVWGQAPGHVAPHACLGQGIAQPLIGALIAGVMRLPGLKPALDPLTGETLQLERLWGFGCTRYPLRFERERFRVQQNLIVSMRVKPPISENAAHLRRLIAGAVPRIEHVLRGFGNLHFAWFEFNDDDTRLVLRTIYDGQFESYLQYFAREAGDLFDGLFEYIDGAPPRPVAEHVHEFVETLRGHNRAPEAGYLYSAYPASRATFISPHDRYQP